MTEEDELEILESTPVKAPSKKKVKVEEEDAPVEVENIIKPKKILTQPQKDALAKGRATVEKNRVVKADARKVKATEDKAELEKKVVAKAISIKKKQIKNQVALDEISDDDTPIEVIRKIVKKVEPVKPKYPFNWT
jgi:hypothetical protein